MKRGDSLHRCTAQQSDKDTKSAIDGAQLSIRCQAESIEIEIVQRFFQIRPNEYIILSEAISVLKFNLSLKTNYLSDDETMKRGKKKKKLFRFSQILCT